VDRASPGQSRARHDLEGRHHAATPPPPIGCQAAVTDTASPKAGHAARAMVVPLALAQFIASYAGTSTNVAISSIAKDLGTTASGVQTAITLFTLTMAALMIPGSKLTDIWDASGASRPACWCTG
jgi:hypothetical protein